MTTSTLGRWASLGCLLVVWALAGCSSDDAASGKSRPSGGGGSSSTADSGDTDSGAPSSDAQSGADAGAPDAALDDPCDGVSCEDGQTCVAGTCQTVAAEGFSCAKPRDLGALPVDAPLRVTVDPTGQPNEQNVGCAVDNQSPEAVFAFRVDQAAEVTFDLVEKQFPLVMELRDGNCASVETAAWCVESSPPRVFYAEPGKTYYLVVEARRGWNVGSFTLQISSNALVCSPPGSYSCNGTKRALCYAGTELQESQCAAGCQAGVCDGDVCPTAILVNGSGTYRGDTQAYSSQINFINQSSCSAAATVGANTPGPEVIFSVPNVRAGQRLYVNTDHADRYEQPVHAVGVMRACGATERCVVATDIDDELEWVVTADGDYTVIVDSFSAAARPFEFRVEVRD